MIRLQDLTPAIYYNQSRDFQFIGRLFDIILNYVKTSADNVYALPCGKNMDEKLLNLLALTLGFQAKHHYNSKHLEAVCSVLPSVLRKKGSLDAVFEAVNALLSSEGIRQALDYYIEPKKYITLYLPEQLTDLTLLQDLLVYILPAGMGCNMVKEIQEVHNVETTITTTDTVTIAQEKSYQWNTAQMLQLKSIENANKELEHSTDWKALIYSDGIPSGAIPDTTKNTTLDTAKLQAGYNVLVETEETAEATETTTEENGD